jgi:transcriptional regulator with XRE-family HTH domain
VANDFTTRLLVRIRTLREAQSLSQEAFAERAGLKYKHYQAIEAGRKPKFQLPTLIKIAEALGLEPWQLLNFDIEPPILTREPKKSGAKKGRAATQIPNG